MIVSVPLTVRFPSTTTSRPNVVIPEIFESPTTVIPKPTDPEAVPIPIPATRLVKEEPSTAGRTAGNLASGIVPEES